MSGRTPRNKTPTVKGKAYTASRVSAKTKSLLRSKTKSDMEDLIKGMQATDLGRPAEGARVEAAVAEERVAPAGPILQPPIFTANAPRDEAMDGLASAMGSTRLGGKRRKTRRHRRHRRRSVRR